jgi:hypothetical protein
VSKLEPLVAAPHSPDNRKLARECSDVKIDRVYIGSCTGARPAPTAGGLGARGGGRGVVVVECKQRPSRGKQTRVRPQHPLAPPHPTPLFWRPPPTLSSRTPPRRRPPRTPTAGGKTEDFLSAAKLFHRAKRQVKVPTFLVPATQKVWADVYTMPVPGCDGKTAAEIFEEAGCTTPAAPSCAACLGGPRDTFARMNEPEVRRRRLDAAGGWVDQGVRGL